MSVKIYSVEEIINYALNLNEVRIKNFINCFRLTKEEIILFKEQYKNRRDFYKYMHFLQCIYLLIYLNLANFHLNVRK